MRNPGKRDDISKFLVHLTREYDRRSPERNLVSILRDRRIDACNSHCLFKYELSRMTAVLRDEFNSVCFTEAPLMQLRGLVGQIPGRQMALAGYGLVFLKETLLQRGANPAIYLNATGTRLRDYLLQRFREDFRGIRSRYRLREREQDHFSSIIQHYSLMNIIAERHDFSWEREWRHQGSFEFTYSDVVAIIAEDPDDFDLRCRRRLTERKYRRIQAIPVIAPGWGYEDIVEEMSKKARRTVVAAR